MIRILITERDASIASLLESVVQRICECDITRTDSPEDADAALLSRTFDVVLLDVGMYSDGMETLSAVKGRNEDCEVIALTTGMIGAPLIKTLAEADVFAILMKPFDTEQLEAVIRESLRPERIADSNHPLVYREFGEKPTRE